MKKILVGGAVSLLLCFQGNLWPQQYTGVPSGSYSFRIYTTNDGLGSLSIRNIIQDTTGFIWVATENGVYRYDGKNFQGFSIEEGLPSTWVDKLFVDAAGTLWAGTYKGLAYFDGDRFVTPRAESGLPPGLITDISNDLSGRLWVGTGQGPYIRQNDGRFELLPGWPGGTVTAIAAQEDGKMWLAGLEQTKVRVLCWQNDHLTPYDLGEQNRIEPIDDMAIDGQKRVWVRTLQSLKRLEPGSNRFVPITPSVPPATQLGNLFTDRQGKLWVTTDKGLYRYEEDHWLTIGKAEGLPYTTIICIFEDREGSVWFASWGLLRMRGGGIWKAHTMAQGLPNNVIWTIHRRPGGDCYIGTDVGLARGRSATWQLVPGTEFMQVRTICEDVDGAFYCSGSPASILRWDPLQQQIQRIGSGEGLAACTVIYKLLLDHQGNLWAASNAGLLLGRRVAGDWVFTLNPLPDADQQERIRSIFEDRDGRIWVPSEFGLAMYEQERWRRFKRKDGLLRDHVSYLTGTRDGDLWLTYFDMGGLTHCRYSDGRLQILDFIDSSQGLLSGKSYMIGEDEAKNIWVGTGVGISILHHQGRIDNFTSEDGLVGDDINAMAFCAENDGNVWVGTSFGLAFFDASAYKIWSLSQPKPQIIDWRFGQKEYHQQGDMPQRVPYKDRTFEIHYSVLSYLRETATEYQVKLIGLEPEWRTVSDLRQRYPGLAAGRYTFVVRARIGQENFDKEASFRFEILPAWWNTWLVRSGLLICMGLLFFGFVRMRMASLQRRNLVLQQMVAERTLEVESKAKELSDANTALETLSLTDPLTGLRNRRFLGVCIPEDIAQVQRVHSNILHGGTKRLSQNIDLLFLMMDIDHFKEINDRFGHEAGDRVLQQIAQILRDATRNSDSIIRWGGEEFLVVARNAARIDSYLLAERIRNQVGCTLFDLGLGRTLARSCSIGFAVYPFVPTKQALFSWEEVINLADHCLLTAKRSGRNCWIGVYPALETNLSAIQHFPAQDIPRWVESGHLVLTSSLANPQILDWPS